jgi:hypothetical protein
MATDNKENTDDGGDWLSNLGKFAGGLVENAQKGIQDGINNVSQGVGDFIDPDAAKEREKKEKREQERRQQLEAIAKAQEQAAAAKEAEEAKKAEQTEQAEGEQDDAAEGEEDDAVEGEEGESLLSRAKDKLGAAANKAKEGYRSFQRNRYFIKQVIEFLIWVLRVIIAYNLQPLLAVFIFFYFWIYSFLGIYITNRSEGFREKFNILNEFINPNKDLGPGMADPFAGKPFFYPPKLFHFLIKNINTWLIPGMLIALLSQSLVNYEDRSKIESESLRMGLKIFVIILISVIGAKTAFNLEVLPKPKIDIDEFDDYELATETLLKPIEEQKELREVEEFLNKNIK